MESKNLIVVPQVGILTEKDVGLFIYDIRSRIEELDTLCKFEEDSSRLLTEIPPNSEKSMLQSNLEELYKSHRGRILRQMHKTVQRLFESRIIDEHREHPSGHQCP